MRAPCTEPAVLLLACLAACAGAPSMPETEPAGDPAPPAVVRADWTASAYVPPALAAPRQRVLLRGILSLPGAELDLTLALALERPDAGRLVGLDDLGGTLFDVRASGAEASVLQGASFLEDALLETLALDLTLLFLGLPASEVRSVVAAGGAVAWRGAWGGGHVLVYRSADGAEERVERGAGGRLAGRARIGEWVTDEDGRARSPRRLSLEGVEGGWRLEAEVVRHSRVDGGADG